MAITTTGCSLISIQVAAWLNAAAPAPVDSRSMSPPATAPSAEVQEPPVVVDEGSQQALPEVTVVPPPTIEEPPEFVNPVFESLTPVRGGLTANDVARRAVASSPTIAEKQADIERAAAQVDRGLVPFIPNVVLSAGYSRLSPVKVNFGDGALVGAANEGLLGVGPCPGMPTAQCVVDAAGSPVGAASFDIPTPLNQFSLRAALSVPVSDYVLSLKPARRGTHMQKEASERFRDAERAKVRTDARIAYYNWLRTVAGVAIAEQSLAHTRERLEDATVALRAGTLSQVDVMRLETRVAATESALVRAVSMEAIAARGLAVIMGSEDAKFGVGEDIMASAPTVAQPREKMVREAFANRQELAGLSLSMDSIDEAIRAAKSRYYPRLDATADVLYANPNPRFFPPSEAWNATASVGAQLSWVLGGALATRSQVREQKAVKRGLGSKAEMLRRGIEMEVSVAAVERTRAARSIELTGKSVASSEEAYNVAVTLYRAGEATTTDILDAEAERVRASLQEVNARIDLRVAEVKLRHAVGHSDTGPAGGSSSSPP